MSAAALRAATTADAAALSALDVEVWRETYAGVLSAALLGGLDRNAFHDLAFFEALLSRCGATERVIVAESADRVVGYCWFGPCGDPGAAQRGEIERLYVAAGSRDCGLGRRLLDEALSTLRARGVAPVRTTVFVANERARRFYERAGAREVGRQAAFEDEGRPVMECVYAWRR